jgi:hypothetical protein
MRILGSPHRWIKHGPFAVGLVAAVVLVLSSPVPATTAGRGLDVRVTANLTGRLGLAPVGTFVSGDELLPVRGRNKARGVTLLTNQAPKPLRFQLRGTPSLHGLDDAVRVHVELDHRPVVDTTLGRFRRWVGWNVVLAPGHAAEMLVRVRLERDTPKAVYVGQLLEVTLGFKATVVAPRSATR